MSLPNGSEGVSDPADDATADRFAPQREALAALDERPLTAHAEVYARVHADLQAALGEIDGL